MLRSAYKVLSVASDARAIARGPKATVKHVVRKRAHKALAKALRRL